MATPLLNIEDLTVRFDTPEGVITAVEGLNLTVEAGSTFGIVGESGSGKSQAMLAVMGLLAANGRATGRALLEGQDLLSMPAAALNRIRGNRLAMVFQDPMTSLNPYLTIERQLTEVLEHHQGASRGQARRRVIEALEAVRIPEAERRLRMYPHECSGGMRQRIMIAMALLCRPALLIADEPTTALDVTVQAQILSLLRDLQRDFGTAILMITHDLGVVAGLCDQVMVMYGARVMEQAPATRLFSQPLHPYTRGLLAAVPRLDGGGHRLAAIPGQPPNAASRPEGCPFATRCAQADTRCHQERPVLQGAAPDPDAGGLRLACHQAVIPAAGAAAAGGLP